MSGWEWLNLVWILPTGLFIIMVILILVDAQRQYAKVRKIHWQLYGGDYEGYHPLLGNTVNQCVLCPVCKGFVVVSRWEEHINKWPGRHYPLHWVRPIEKEFEQGRKRLEK